MSDIETPLKETPFSKNLILPVLLDADILVYRAGFSPEVTSETTAIAKVNDIVDFIKNNTSSFDLGQYKFYLTGKDNFRHEVAKTAEYKANRKGKPKPEYVDFIRGYLRLKYDAEVYDGQEADDAIATDAAKLGYNCIAASIDKDYLQIPCWHYNFGRNEWYKPDEFGGLKFFYQQILTGDGVDNIVGLWRVGPKKAAKMLEGCTTERELYEACVLAYEEAIIKNPPATQGWVNECDMAADRVLENARLLWLRRYEGEMWTPPEE